MEDQTCAADVHTLDPQGAGDGEWCKFSRDEMLAIYRGMGDSYYTGVTEVWAVLEPLSQEVYEMDVDHGAQKARHKTIDRRQRGKKAKEVTSTEVEENSYKDLLLELGLDVPSQSQSSVSESEAYEDDSEEEVESFQPLAFHVEGEPDFESGEPQDGWEYLRPVKRLICRQYLLCQLALLICSLPKSGKQSFWRTSEIFAWNTQKLFQRRRNLVGLCRQFTTRSDGRLTALESRPAWWTRKLLLLRKTVSRARVKIPYCPLKKTSQRAWVKACKQRRTRVSTTSHFRIWTL